MTKLLAVIAVCGMVAGAGCGTPEERAARKAQKKAAKELRVKVSGLVKSAADAQAAGQLETATKDVNEALSLDPQNEKAQKIDAEVDIAIAKAAAEKMKPDAAAKLKEVEALEKGQGFEALVKNMAEMMKDADAVLAQANFESAMQKYRAAITEGDRIVELDVQRKAASEKLAMVEQAGKAAEEAKAPADAVELWAGAKAEEEVASVLFEQGDFAQTLVKCEATIEAFGKAKAWAEGRQTVRIAQQAFDADIAAVSEVPLEQFGGQSWKKTRSTASLADEYCIKGEWTLAVEGWNAAREWLKVAVKDAVTAAEIERQRQEHLRAVANFMDAMAKAEEKLAFAVETAKTEVKGMDAVQAGLTILKECETAPWYKLLLPAEIVKLPVVRQSLTIEKFHYRYPDLAAVVAAEPVGTTGLATGSDDAVARQKETSSKLELPIEVVSRKSGIRFRLVPAGSFQMGSGKEENKQGDETLCTVEITKPYYMGIYEISQSEWAKLGLANNASFKDETGRKPIEMVSWAQAEGFCQKLSSSEGVAKGVYRLPTEAEWESACRAGTPSAYYTGDHRFDLERSGWFSKNSGRTSHVPGGLSSNAWGLCDMLGNVWEWCDDGKRVYDAGSVAKDPRGDSDDMYRVTRGGGWRDPASECRSANRGAARRDKVQSYDLGFRVMRALDPQ